MFYSHSADELMEIGYKIGQKLEVNDLLVLTGELGSGKTTLTKGIAKGLDIGQMIKSPTYTIVREYQGRLPLYHLDVYRIGGDSASIDLDDFIFGDGVTIIEWGSLLGEALPEDYLEIFIENYQDGRQLTFKANGLRAQKLMEELQND